MNDMIGPYLDRLCTPEQRERWFPGYCSGELIAAIAMTEPEAGSDLQGIRSTAELASRHDLTASPPGGTRSPRWR